MCKILRKLFKKQQNPTLKMGAKAKIGDLRTIQLSAILNTAKITSPVSFNVDHQLATTIPNPMYQNDIHNCCVIAGRGHMTLRLEEYEQDTIIPITDSDILTEYYKESGGADNGLYMLNSLKCWRQGWIAAGNNYNIYAYAAVNPRNHAEVKAAVSLLHGLYVAVNLSMSCQAQWQYGNPWTYHTVDGIIGNHCVYVLGYDGQYVYCVSWGKLQRMTWEFWDNMCTEAYAIIDDKDKWVADSVLDVEKCENLLNQIHAIPADSVTNVTVTVVDKKNVPVLNCQVMVFKNDTAAQTYAYSDVKGTASFVALTVGETYQFTVEYQAPNKQVVYPVTITKIIDKSDASSTTFTMQLQFDYLASYFANKIIL